MKAQARMRSLCALLLVFIGCSRGQVRSADAPSVAPRALGYLVRHTAPPNEVLEVRIELPPHAPLEWMFTEPGPVETVTVTRPGGDEVFTLAADDTLRVPDDARALSYVYPLADEAGLRGGRLRRAAGGQGPSRHVTGRVYLLRPRVALAQQPVALRVQSPLAVHLPWIPEPDGVYRLSAPDLVDSGVHVFGGRSCTLEGRVHVVILEGETKVPFERLCDVWLAQAVKELRMVLPSRYPFPRTLVSLVPVDSEDASPFGMLLWSTPPSVALYVGTRATEDAFRRDWVALHELLHQLHASFGGEAPWLSEGIATYYTEVARMRSGRLTPEEGWAELAEGFSRGAAQSRGLGMNEAVQQMQRGVYQPAYWTGALLMLELDVRLRELSRGARSLDDVLERIAGRRTGMTVRDFGREVDQVAGEPLFQELLAFHQQGPALSRAQPLLESLGVRYPASGGKIQLLRGTSRDEIRTEIESVTH